MSESTILKQILLALGDQADFICWRNNTGKLADATGRWVTYGLGVGSADIIGVLAPWGRFVAFEVKTAKGKQRDQQVAWQAAVRSNGGSYYIVRSVDDALRALRSARDVSAELRLR